MALENQFENFSNDIELNMTSVNRKITNLMFEAKRINDLDLNLEILKEDLSFKKNKIENLSYDLERLKNQENTNVKNIDSLADQVDGINIIGTSTLQLINMQMIFNQNLRKNQEEYFNRIIDNKLNQAVQSNQASNLTVTPPDFMKTSSLDVVNINQDQDRVNELEVALLIAQDLQRRKEKNDFVEKLSETDFKTHLDEIYSRMNINA